MFKALCEATFEDIQENAASVDMSFESEGEDVIEEEVDGEATHHEDVVKGTSTNEMMSQFYQKKIEESSSACPAGDRTAQTSAPAAERAKAAWTPATINGGNAKGPEIIDLEAEDTRTKKKAIALDLPPPGSPKAKVPSSLSKVKKQAKSVEAIESKVTFSDVGGMEKVLVDICKLLVHLKHPEIYDRVGVTPPKGFLLHGPPGCGKTLLANAVAGQLKLPLIKLAGTEVVSGVSGEAEKTLRELFEQAVATAPCLLFIDEIDAIAGRRDQASKSMESRIVSQLLSCLDDVEGRVVVIGATNCPEKLDPALRRAGRFEKEIALGIPDEKARKAILQVLTTSLNLEQGFDTGMLARVTPGYVGADLSALCREAALIAVNRIFKSLSTTQSALNHPSSESVDSARELNELLHLMDNPETLTAETLSNIAVTFHDFEAALRLVQPSAKREGFATVPDVTWDDIGALSSIREELELSILAPVNHPEVTKALEMESPTGILLCGPPGCGKTLLAKAVANQAGINFISVKGPELLNMVKHGDFFFRVK